MNNISFRNPSSPLKIGISRRRGSVLVIVAASLLALMGFCAIAVDYGVSVTEKNRLQRTCDAAALAGASQLKVTGIPATDLNNARTEAIRTAARNGVTLANGDIMPDGISTTRIRVSKASPRKFLFGAAIGMPNGQVVASSLAGRSYVTGVKGLQPLGVSLQTYLKFVPTAANPNPGSVDLVLTRNTQEKFGPLNSEAINLSTNGNGTKNWPGNTVFSALALDLRFGNSGGSGALFEEDLKTGNNPTQVNLGILVDPIGSSLASQGQKLSQAVDVRITTSTRTMYILVGADGYAANNSNPQLSLAYFAPVRVETAVTSTRGSNPTAVLTVTFLPGQLSSAATGSIIDSAVFGTGETDTGLSALRLLD